VPQADESAPALPPIKNSTGDESPSYNPEPPVTQSYKASNVTENMPAPEYSPSPERAVMTRQDGRSSSNTNESTSEENTSSDLPVVAQKKAVAKAATATSTTADTDPPPKETFWEKNKSWLKPVAIGVGGISIIAIGMRLLKPNQPASRATSSKQGLSGVPHKKRNHKRRGKQKHNHHSKKKAVALL